MIVRICGLSLCIWLAVAPSATASPLGDHGEADLLARLAAAEGVALAPPGGTRHRLIVFTDLHCPYCAVLHHRIPDYLRLGIRIEYLFYPRSGPGSPAFEQAVAAWCARDPSAALDRAFAGTTLTASGCEHPVLQHYELAQRLGLKGTPAWITDDGTVMYGAISPGELIRRLEILRERRQRAVRERTF